MPAEIPETDDLDILMGDLHTEPNREVLMAAIQAVFQEAHAERRRAESWMQRYAELSSWLRGNLPEAIQSDIPPGLLYLPPSATSSNFDVLLSDLHLKLERNGRDSLLTKAVYVHLATELPPSWRVEEAPYVSDGVSPDLDLHTELSFFKSSLSGRDHLPNELRDASFELLSAEHSHEVTDTDEYGRARHRFVLNGVSPAHMQVGRVYKKVFARPERDAYRGRLEYHSVLLSSAVPIRFSIEIQELGVELLTMLILSKDGAYETAPTIERIGQGYSHTVEYSGTKGDRVIALWHRLDSSSSEIPPLGESATNGAE